MASHATHRHRSTLRLAVPLAAALVAFASPAPAQIPEEAEADPARSNAGQSIELADTDDADNVSPMQQQIGPPEVEPEREPGIRQVPGSVGAPAPDVRIDRDVLGLPPEADPPPLRREGEFLVSQPGRVVRSPDTPEWIFVPLPRDNGEPPGPAMVLQPTRDLQTIIGVSQEYDQPPIFTLSGMIHRYRGVNYLLPTIAEPPQRQPDAEAPEDAPDPQDDAEIDPLEQLLQQRREAPDAIAPAPDREPDDTMAPAVRGTAPDDPGTDLLAEGTIIADRRGHLVRSPDGANLLFAFHADDPDSPEAPMILHRNRLLQQMERIALARGDRIVFSISGQVYTFRGANYLLPTMMRVVPDRENLQP